MTRSGVRPAPIPDQRRRPWIRPPRVAVGTDGSEWGDNALDWALRHGSLLNATLRVFAATVADDRAIARRLRAYKWLHATVDASPGTPVGMMVTASYANDLLVIGYRGRQHGSFGLGRSVIPVVVGAHCDTVVVRGEMRAVHGEHRWITAAVGGRHDRLVVRRAAQAAVRTRSRLRLVHAAPLLPGRHVAPDDPAVVLERAADVVHDLVPRLIPSLLLARSQPHEAVRAASRSDLLVIGPGKGPDRLSMVTSTALHLAPCPVMVVKPT
ncbi:universal stress protein [Kibdelosporangium lantanae]